MISIEQVTAMLERRGYASLRDDSIPYSYALDVLIHRASLFSRLLEMLVTQAIHSGYLTQHQGLPSNIAALLHGWQSPGDL